MRPMTRLRSYRLRTARKLMPDGRTPTTASDSIVLPPKRSFDRRTYAGCCERNSLPARTGFSRRHRNRHRSVPASWYCDRARLEVAQESRHGHIAQAAHRGRSRRNVIVAHTESDRSESARDTTQSHVFTEKLVGPPRRSKNSPALRRRAHRSAITSTKCYLRVVLRAPRADSSPARQLD